MDLKIHKVIMTAPVELHGDWCLFNQKKNCHLGTYADSTCIITTARFTVYTSDWSCVGEVDAPRAQLKTDDWDQRCHDVAMAVKKRLSEHLIVPSK